MCPATIIFSLARFAAKSFKVDFPKLLQRQPSGLFFVLFFRRLPALFVALTVLAARNAPATLDIHAGRRPALRRPIDRFLNDGGVPAATAVDDVIHAFLPQAVLTVDIAIVNFRVFFDFLPLRRNALPLHFRR